MKYFIRYGEVGIKSPKIRKKFENKLMNNIQRELKCHFDNNFGRITLISEEEDEKVRQILDRVFGIVSYSKVYETKTQKEEIIKLVNQKVTELIEEGKFIPESESFAVKCRRVGNHDFSSQEMAAFVGSVIIDLTNAKVNLSNPDFTLYVEVRDDKTYIYTEKIKGLGGLPVGTQGRVICLISGGIDSPVAAFQMLKRGCSITLLHCDNNPYGNGTVDKVLKHTKILQKYSIGEQVKLYTIKYGKYLEQMIKNAPPRMTCVLCKSGMYQSAEILAKTENAKAIADGSSIGQVASQTLDNINASRYHCKMPIFSPLITFDKLEIESVAKKIGTYDISIISDGGCGAVPKYPETHADLDVFKNVVEDISQAEIINDIVKSFEQISIEE